MGYLYNNAIGSNVLEKNSLFYWQLKKYCECERNVSGKYLILKLNSFVAVIVIIFKGKERLLPSSFSVLRPRF